MIYTKYGPPEVLQPSEVATPIPRDNEVRIRIRVATCTMGDCELRSPKIPDFTWFIVRLFFGLFKPRRKILGGYFAGDVEAIGKDVTRFKVGDAVFGLSVRFGSFAEYLCLPENHVFVLKPPALSYEEVAPVALGLDSLHFVGKTQLQGGEEMLINGAGGGIGTYAVQLARSQGAEVTAVDTADKHEMLRSAGAAHVIDHTLGDFTRSGKKYDIIFDVVGKISHRRASRLLKPGGLYITAIPQITRILISAWGNLTTSKRFKTGLTSGKIENLERMRDLLQEGKIKTFIDRTYRLEELVEAQRYIESGQKRGNIVMTVAEAPQQTTAA